MTGFSFDTKSFAPEKVHRLIKSGEFVRETPHLGGPHRHKYALTLGGLASQVVLVDTVKARRDKFGSVGTIGDLAIASNSQAERRIAASMHAFEVTGTRAGTASMSEIEAAIEALGLSPSRFIDHNRVNLVELHLEAVRRVVSERTKVQTFRQRWQSLDSDWSYALLKTAAELGLIRRRYDAGLEKVMHFSDQAEAEKAVELEKAYFDDFEDDDGVLHTDVGGVLPPVETLFAMEALLALSEGRDIIYDHLYCQSTRYASCRPFKDHVQKLVEGTLSKVGEQLGRFTYVFLAPDPEMAEEWDRLGGEEDHLSVLRRGEKFDWTGRTERSVEREPLPRPRVSEPTTMGSRHNATRPLPVPQRHSSERPAKAPVG